MLSVVQMDAGVVKKCFCKMDAGVMKKCSFVHLQVDAVPSFLFVSSAGTVLTNVIGQAPFLTPSALSTLHEHGPFYPFN